MIKKNSRRSFIKKTSLVASIPLYIPSLYSASTMGLNDPIGHGDFKFEINKNWGVQNSNTYPIDHCHEMVIDSKNRIILTTTHAKNNILIYDRSGKVLDSWTLNYPGAHGLSIVDQGGEEFLFITDPDSNRVCKTTLKGEKLLELSYPKEIKAYTSASQFKPTEIAIAENGDFYVADGYGLDYIIQYDNKGNYVHHFGGHGEGNDLFDCCHGITIDSRDKSNPTLLISSRSKNEFKRFSLDGKWIETIKLPGCYVCRPVIKGEYLLFAVIVTKDWGVYDGMLAVLDNNNKVVSFPGGSFPSYLDQTLVKPEYDQVSFRNPHDVCVDDDWNLYVPQWNSEKTYPVKLTRV
jgi:peptidylamidoglycolate lyase|tara:strand:+ start:54 stop:1100 length:1047 start_codon:yes stop_codon:yes gene_type:complete